MQERSILVVLMLGTLCFRAAPADNPADRFAGQIHQYKESATAVREALAGLMGELGQVPAFSKTDGPLMTKHLEEAAETWTKAAAALEQGDETTGSTLAKRAQEMTGQRDRWQERVRWRALQAQHGEYLPATAEIFFILAVDRKEEEVKQIEAFLESKKRRSEAYGRLAEATVPGADPQALFKLQEAVYGADVEVGVADMKHTWFEEDLSFRRWIGTDPTITSAELTTAKQRLAEWRRQREEAYRQNRAQQHALERLERERAGLLAVRESAYRAAKAAQDRLKPSQ